MDYALANHFVGRMVIIQPGGGGTGVSGTHTPARMMAVFKKDATVIPKGSGTTINVPLERLKPWWSENPDLIHLKESQKAKKTKPKAGGLDPSPVRETPKKTEKKLQGPGMGLQPKPQSPPPPSTEQKESQVDNPYVVIDPKEGKYWCGAYHGWQREEQRAYTFEKEGSANRSAGQVKLHHKVSVEVCRLNTARRIIENVHKPHPIPEPGPPLSRAEPSFPSEHAPTPQAAYEPAEASHTSNGTTTQSVIAQVATDKPAGSVRSQVQAKAQQMRQAIQDLNAAEAMVSEYKAKIERLTDEIADLAGG